jgi:hypothetical protein
MDLTSNLMFREKRFSKMFFFPDHCPIGKSGNHSSNNKENKANE